MCCAPPIPGPSYEDEDVRGIEREIMMGLIYDGIALVIALAFMVLLCGLAAGVWSITLKLISWMY